MREIVFDTETTGLEVEKGHRIIDIGAIELFDKIPTGKTFQVYINPEIVITEENTKIHGLTNEFLRNKPTFQEIAEDLLIFFGDSILVAHNANFDIGFLNNELLKAGVPLLKNKVKDTLEIAKSLYRNSFYSLDALCRRFGISKERRVIHGALLDANLLAKVYYFLSTSELSFDCFEIKKEEEKIEKFSEILYKLTEKEKVEHETFLKEILKK